MDGDNNNETDPKGSVSQIRQPIFNIQGNRT